MNTSRHILPSQKGVALVTSLVLLLIMTLVAVASMRFSRLELKMAGNNESRTVGLQRAQAVIDAAVATPDAIPVIGSAGFSICTAAVPGCDLNTMAIPAGLFEDDLANGNLGVFAQRRGPDETPVPRGLATSADRFYGASFSVQARHDRADEGLGRVDLVEGVLVLVPNN